MLASPWLTRPAGSSSTTPGFSSCSGSSPTPTSRTLTTRTGALGGCSAKTGLLDVDEHPVRQAALTRKPVRDKLVAVRLPSGGDPIWILVNAEPLMASDGKVEHLICTYQDVTEQRRADQALRQYADLLEHSAVLVRDGDDRIIVWNRGMERLYGWPRDDALGKVSHDLLKTRFRCPWPTLRSNSSEPDIGRASCSTSARTGVMIVVASRQFVHLDPVGRRLAVVEVNSDVTALRRRPSRPSARPTRNFARPTNGGTSFWESSPTNCGTRSPPSTIPSTCWNARPLTASERRGLVRSSIARRST